MRKDTVFEISADEALFQAVVESTLAGRRAYEKAGFKAEIERMDMDTGEKFDKRPKPVLVFMRR